MSSGATHVVGAAAGKYLGMNNTNNGGRVINITGWVLENEWVSWRPFDGGERMDSRKSLVP